MSTEYQIPKRKVRATVACLGEPDRDIWLYLSERAETHSGPERPGDLLNGHQPFIPATDEAGDFSLLQTGAITLISVPEDAESDPGSLALSEPAGTAIAYDIRVRLLGDREVQGRFSVVRPEGQQRLQDGLNGPQRFFAIKDGDRVHLVNRKHVIWIAQIGQD